MTKPPGSAAPEPATRVRCGWCRRLLEPVEGPGRPRSYCRRSCRQRAYEARQTTVALDWAGDRIREQSRALDEVSVLTRALEDVLEPRGVGPVSELDEAGVEELLERLRTLARDLSSVVRGEREDDTP